MIKNLCIITNKYPNKYEPNVVVFVQQLVWQLAKQGVNCTVISPMQVNIHPKYITMPFDNVELTDTWVRPPSAAITPQRSLQSPLNCAWSVPSKSAVRNSMRCIPTL